MLYDTKAASNNHVKLITDSETYGTTSRDAESADHTLRITPASPQTQQRALKDTDEASSSGATDTKLQSRPGVVSKLRGDHGVMQTPPETPCAGPHQHCQCPNAERPPQTIRPRPPHHGVRWGHLVMWTCRQRAPTFRPPMVCLFPSTCVRRQPYRHGQCPYSPSQRLQIPGRRSWGHQLSGALPPPPSLSARPFPSPWPAAPCISFRADTTEEIGRASVGNSRGRGDIR
ncbi:hypothetical protein B0H21DRAFT_169986 [Amylocystis lapponica]|nr:hypothetical protein B0H21DRAFT_169986 [Amylocystis lapponica]